MAHASAPASATFSHLTTAAAPAPSNSCQCVPLWITNSRAPLHLLELIARVNLSPFLPSHFSLSLSLFALENTEARLVPLFMHKLLCVSCRQLLGLSYPLECVCICNGEDMEAAAAVEKKNRRYTRVQVAFYPSDTNLVSFQWLFTRNTSWNLSKCTVILTVILCFLYSEECKCTLVTSWLNFALARQLFFALFFSLARSLSVNWIAIQINCFEGLLPVTGEMLSSTEDVQMEIHCVIEKVSDKKCKSFFNSKSDGATFFLSLSLSLALSFCLLSFALSSTLWYLATFFSFVSLALFAQSLVV